MKWLLSCFILLALQSGANGISCRASADTEPVECTDDDAAAEKCHHPTFTDYVGWAAGADWGCGACADGAENCVDCLPDACLDVSTIVSFQCKKYTAANVADAAGTSTCLTNPGVAEKCNRAIGAAAPTNDGCGPGANDADYVTCEGASCNGGMCNSDAEGTVTLCGADATKCKRPTFTDWVGWTAVNGDNAWGCGECGEAAQGCFDCDLADDTLNCNKLETATFKCYDYEVSGEKLVKKTGDAGACPMRADTDGKCNYPGSAATKTYSVNNNGCGPCADDAAADTCEECEEQECGAQATALSVLAVLAAMFAMM